VRARSTEIIDIIEKHANDRRFWAEARASEFPLLRSASAETILTGFSFAGALGALTMVETNQVSRRLRSDGLPFVFTNRTSRPRYDLDCDDGWDPWLVHAKYHVTNDDLESLAQTSTKAGHDRLIARLLKPERYDRDVVVDGQVRLAHAFDFEGTVFARLKPTSRFELTIAAPEFIMQWGFVTGVPG
jgi:hypothetical protein